MSIVRIDPRSPERGAIARAAALLGQGQLVAFPTETVYGLGANALDPAAVGRIYEVKGRPAYNPLIVHVADASGARRLVSAWPETAERLAARWWPGPLTLVLPKSRDIPAEVTAGLNTVALRVPAHPVALALLGAAGIPVAAPSANRSGEVSPTTAEHVFQSLGDRVPMILDGGPAMVGIESTVIDLSERIPCILRPGMISKEEVEAVVGPVTVAAPSAEGPDAPRPSPGMLERHYAPRAQVLLYRGAAEGLAQASEVRSRGGEVAALVRTARLSGVSPQEQLPDEPTGYARELYGALRRLDSPGLTALLVELPPAGPDWTAIRDRLARAARE